MVVLLASTALPLATMAPPPPMVAMREEAEAATLDLRLGGLRGARWLRLRMWGPPVGAKESGMRWSRAERMSLWTIAFLVF